MEFVNRWEREHEGFQPVLGSPDEQLLVRMQKLGYISLAAAPNGNLYYSQEDLEKAKMWEEKLK